MVTVEPLESTGLRTDAEALHAALSELLRLYQFRDRNKICCHDISVTQCHALETLIERGPCRSQTLAEALLLDKSTTTRVVDALVRKGYVERRVDAEDARALALHATTAGRRLHRRINDELIEQQIQLLQDLTPEVRNGATELIRRLARVARTRFLSAGASCAVVAEKDGSTCC